MTARLGASGGAAVVAGGADRTVELRATGLDDGGRGTAVATPETAGVPDASGCGRVGPEAIAAA
jgi:hypothetical protein